LSDDDCINIVENSHLEKYSYIYIRALFK
jgi:hypothetical protein